MAQRVTHAEEIETGIREGNIFRATFDQRYASRKFRTSQHAGTGVETGNQRRVTDDLCRAPRDEARADADVEDAHSRLQSGPQQSFAPVAGARAESDNAFGAVVVGRRVVEQVLHPVAALRFVLVIRRQGRVGGVDDVVAITCWIDHRKTPVRGWMPAACLTMLRQSTFVWGRANERRPLRAAVTISPVLSFRINRQVDPTRRDAHAFRLPSASRLHIFRRRTARPPRPDRRVRRPEIARSRSPRRA